MAIPYPPDEAERLRALRAYDVLNTPPEASFDRLTRLAAAHFNVPIALITLLDENEQFFKSCVGLDTRRTSREVSFCTYTIVEDEVMVVEDATTDPRFRDNPLVTGEPGIRFYAGAPLKTPGGHNPGSLCLIDTTPRTFAKAEAETLADMAAMVVDELELRRTAREMEESEARYRSVVNSVQEIIFELDTEGRWRFVNPAWEDLLGYRTEDTMGRPFLNFIHPDDRDACTARFAEVACGDKASCKTEVRYVSAHGDTCWFEVNAWMMCDSAGQPRGISGTLYDLTERRAAEQTLRRAKGIADQLVEERTEQLVRTNQQLQQMATLVDHAGDAIWVQDADGRITYWNKSAEALYGWSWGEAVGATVQSLLHETGDTTYAEVRNQAQEQGAWSGELAHQTRSGRTVHVDSRWSRAAAHEASGAAFLVVNTDITERKDLEQQVRRAQRMESLGKLAGSVAHDVNNVLGPILMSLEMLETVATDDRSQRLIQALASGAERGAGLMRQLLSFARGSEGAPKVMPLGPVLDELKGMIGDTIPANIDTTFTIAPDLHQVKGDATQLHQVFMNLVVNACDAMEEGGTLTVRAENVTIDADVPTHLEALPGTYVRVSVADTGPGMAPDVREKIFDPFYTTKADGTGLGLSTTLGIVRGHHGFIDLDTEPGEGTTFEVYLPVAYEEAAPDAAVASPIPRAEGQHVLLAEDEVGLRLVTKRVLEAQGYVVHAAANGAEAGRWLRGHGDTVDVVITDVMMPVVDGRGLLRMVQEVAPAVPVVAVSGLASKESMVTEDFPQVKAFLAKPYRADVLLRTLHEVLTSVAMPA
ncbi:MAG: PAS domain S-box protein [Bacteroidetes bacterium]|nr:PAS domain S-box protein [Bacteroidota bacterium]